MSSTNPRLLFQPTSRSLILAIALGLLAAGTFAPPTPAQDSSQAEQRRIIDVHLHALPLDMLPAHMDTLAGYERPESAEALRRQTINQLERYSVTKAVTSGDSELLTEYKKAASDRIIRSLWIPWDIKEDSLRTYLDSLSRWHEQGRFQVIGEVLTQYSGIAPNDSVLEPLWSFAERNGVPVGIHIGPTTTNALPGYTPLAMKDVLAEHPDLKVYVMHAGYPKVEDMIDLMEIYPNIHVDLAGMLFIVPRDKTHRYLRGLVEAGYANRIMFGSDQMLWPQSMEESIDAIEAADFLTEKQKQAIFYENAARFFDIESGISGDS